MQTDIFMRHLNTAALAKSKQAVLDLLSDGESHTSVEICSVGGTSGLRRLRELRELGYPIHGEPLSGSNMWLYKLDYPAPEVKP